LPHCGSNLKEEANAMLVEMETIVNGRASPFLPGVGRMAILLKGDGQIEEGEDEDEEEEDDDDDGDGPPVCDSLLELLRANKLIQKNEWNLDKSIVLFLLPSSSPWRNLDLGDLPEGEESGEEVDVTLVAASLIELADSSRSSSSSDGSPTTTIIGNQFPQTIVARFPIFDEDSGSNAALMCSTLSLLDRFYIGEMVREVMAAHQPKFGENENQVGDVKNVAEEVVSVLTFIQDQVTLEAAIFSVTGERANERKWLQPPTSTTN